MNKAISVLLWKEYRTYRGLWLLAVLFAVAWLVILPFSQFMRIRSNLNAGTYWDVAVLFVCLYSIGVSSTLFNHEHDSRSYALLQWLPMKTTSLWLGKIGFVVLSVVSLAVVQLSMAAAFIQVNFGKIEVTPELVGIAFLPPVTVFVGLICSLVIRRSLLSPFIAGAIVSLCIAAWIVIGGSSVVANFLWNVFGTRSRLWILQLDDWVLFSGTFCFVGCILSLPLTHIWLGRRASFLTHKRAKSIGSRHRQSAAKPFALPYAETRFPSKLMIQRLIWLQVRQMRWIWLSLFVLTIAVSPIRTYPYAPGILLFVWPAVLGLSVFVGDHVDNIIPFFTDRRIRATHVWFARQIVPCSLLVAVLMAERFSSWFVNTEVPTGYLLQTFLTFAAAQVLAIYITKPMIAAFIAIGIIPFLTNWTTFVWELRLPLSLCIFMPALALLAACYLKTKNLFTEFWSKRRLGIANVLLAASTLTVLYLGIWTYRIHQVPSTIALIDPNVFTETHKPNRQKVELYQAAIALSTDLPNRDGAYQPDGIWVNWSELPLPISPAESAWLTLDANSQALEKALAAVEHPNSPLRSDVEFDSGFEGMLPRIVRLCIAKARQLRADKKAESAIEYEKAALEICTDRRLWTRFTEHINTDERLVIWHLLFAASTTESVAAIDSMKELLKEHIDAQPRWEELRKAEYIFARQRISEYLGSSRSTRRLGLLPGERQRALRLCDVGFSQPWNTYNYDAFRHAVKTTPGLRRLGIFPETWHWDIRWEAMGVNNLHRAALLQFDIQKWRLENGRYPRDISETNIKRPINGLRYFAEYTYTATHRFDGKFTYFDPLGSYRVDLDVPIDQSIVDESAVKGYVVYGQVDPDRDPATAGFFPVPIRREGSHSP